MKTIVKQNQIGLLFKKSKFKGFLKAGVYSHLPSTTIEVLNCDNEILSNYLTKKELLSADGASELFDCCEVGEQELGFHFLDGVFKEVLESGAHIFVKENRTNNFVKTSCEKSIVDSMFPEYLFTKIPSKYFVSFLVPKYQKGLFFINSKFQSVLEPGKYYFWKTAESIEIKNIAIAKERLELNGQEVLTSDKATIRVNLVCYYTVIDPVKAYETNTNFLDEVYLKLQFALRDFVGAKTLDEILESKKAINEYVYNAVKDECEKAFIEINEVGVKDIILPGDMRDIMNTVLVASKKAQANVITRREEVASTRSLLNTAKMMEDNPTLYKLKEMEFIERISDKIGSINVTGSGDVVSQLTSILKK